ncbi:hypothetical protein AB0O22_25045 [Streptomyces sp. NPDC091204]|uniref:hypothetical protein n=1 Tax=Streptomyces sp. NPDC091204 TaxID=3155299 RepID=UPI00342FB91C
MSGRIAMPGSVGRPVTSWKTVQAARFRWAGPGGVRTETVRAGGLVGVPPGTVHAFGAAPQQGADLLVVLTPGIDRFGYFRALGRVRRGEEPFESLLPEQDRYDVHFADRVGWGEPDTD